MRSLLCVCSEMLSSREPVKKWALQLGQLAGAKGIQCKQLFHKEKAKRNDFAQDRTGDVLRVKQMP